MDIINIKYIIIVGTLLIHCSISTHISAKTYSLHHDGIEREYILRKPDAKFSIAPRPTIIVLHGGGGSAESAEYVTGFTEKALPKGYIIAYPNGTNRFSRLKKGRTWNATHCCAHAMKQNIDDIGFISKLIDHLIDHENADPRRIYITGISNGAMMTHMIATELSDKITAIAPVIGCMFGKENIPNSPVATLIINGKNDSAIPFNGGTPHPQLQKSFDGTEIKPALYQGQFWARANGCDTIPETRIEANGKLTVDRYHCPKTGSVIQFTLNNGTHSWPGGQKNRINFDDSLKWLDASNLIISFFSNQRKTLP